MSDSTTTAPETAAAGAPAAPAAAAPVTTGRKMSIDAKLEEDHHGDGVGADFFRTPDERRRLLADFAVYLADRTQHHLGYPYNLEFDTGALAPFLQYSINNLGDPFVPSNYGVHSRVFEVELLNFFADLWKIPRDQYWGYVTTCGTEGNLLGVLYGREKLPDGILYCSRDTHYSVPKAGHLYRIPVEFVDSQETGEIVYEDLIAKLTKNKGKPAIVSFNAGTTVKGAVDCADKVLECLKTAGYSRDQYFVHCDGALAGLIIPWVAGCDTSYDVHFEKDIDSISVSGHKMLGCAMPCGVVLTRKEHMERFKRDVEYLNSTDTTIMGSRNGQAALAMWYALQCKGIQGMKRDVAEMVENAEFLVELFGNHGITAQLNPLSSTVVFPRPSEEVVRKWQLACVRDIAHIVVMPSVTRTKLRAFLADYMAARAGKPIAGASGRSVESFSMQPPAH